MHPSHSDITVNRNYQSSSNHLSGDYALGAAPSSLSAQSDRTIAESSEESPAPILSTSSPEVRGWRRAVLNFDPSWFSVTMGTGVVGMLLHDLPFQASWIYYLSVVFFVFNVLLFTVFSLVTIIRFIIFPEAWGLLINHPVQSLYLGCIPMGFASIVSMFGYICVPVWGEWAMTMLWVMWWIEAISALCVCVYLPFIITYLHSNELSQMTALWLLPIVSCVVASACSGIVAGILTNPSHTLTTLICGYLLWGMGFPMAALVLAIYFARLALHNLPPRDTLVSVFLPLGPMGMGGYAMMQLGLVAKSVLPATGALSPNAGEMLYVGGFAVALVLWGWGFVWGFIAVASVTRGRFPFNMGWWGFVFPIGVFSVSTLTLGKELPSPVFDYLGTVLAAVVILIWTVVAVGTVRKTVRGDMMTSVHCEQNSGRGGREDEEAARVSVREGEGENGEKRNVD